MERKMDENKEHMKPLEQKLDGKLEQMEHKIIEVLNGKFPKIDKVSEETHENKCSIQFEQLSNIMNFLGVLIPIMGLLMDGLQKE
jgi:hypothetical protein